MRTRRLAIALFLAASVAPLRANDLPTFKSARAGGVIDNVPSMTMEGVAEEIIKPDYALMVLDAANDAATVAAAASKNAAKVQFLLARLKKLGFAGADVQLRDLVVQGRYREQKDPNSETPRNVLIGYHASTVFRVEIRDLDAAPRVAREMLEGGDNAYSSMSFEIRDKPERLAALRDKALQNAVANAQHFAKLAAVDIGDMLRVTTPVERAPGAPLGIAKEHEGEIYTVPAEARNLKLYAMVSVTWEIKSKDGRCAGDSVGK